MAGRPWPVTGHARVAFEGLTAKGVNWANVVWVNSSQTAVPTPANVIAAATALYECYDDTFSPLQGKDSSLERCVVNWYGVPGSQVTGAYEESTAGGSANNSEVDSLSAVVSWQFPSTWRDGKPRLYLPNLPSEAFADSNRLDSTFITNLASAAASFRTAVNGVNVTGFGPCVLVVESFFSANAPRTTTVAFAISGATVHPRISSQRRRLGREVP